MRWLLTPTGTTLHRPYTETSLLSMCGRYLSRRRTDDREQEVGENTLPRCKRCEAVSPP